QKWPLTRTFHDWEAYGDPRQKAMTCEHLREHTRELGGFINKTPDDPLETARSLHPPFVFKRTVPCLCKGGSMFVTLVFSLWLCSLAIPESASFFRSASLV